MECTEKHCATRGVLGVEELQIRKRRSAFRCAIFSLSDELTGN